MRTHARMHATKNKVTTTITKDREHEKEQRATRRSTLQDGGWGESKTEEGAWCTRTNVPTNSAKQVQRERMRQSTDADTDTRAHTRTHAHITSDAVKEKKK